MKVTISVGGKFHAFQLAKALEEKGYLDTIFTSYPWYSLKDTGVSKKRIKSLITKEALERGLYRIPSVMTGSIVSHYINNIFDWQVARRIRPCDIFVGWSCFSLYTLRKIRRLSPSKVIIERGSCHIETQQSILKEEGERLGIKTGLPCRAIVEKELREYEEADCIFVPSALAKNAFGDRNVPVDKVVQVALGVDTQRFKPIPKDDRKFRIIFIGLSIVKGLHYFLQAIDELKIKDMEVWLIGGINEDIRSFLSKYSSSFRHLGIIPHRELYKYYSQGSLFVNFALEDGFALALLEAMACGLPVICTYNTGAKDIVRDGVDGYILPTQDVEALKEKIAYFYQNQNRAREMGEQARLGVESNFTWGHYGQRVIRAYDNVLKPNKENG